MIKLLAIVGVVLAMIFTTVRSTKGVNTYEEANSYNKTLDWIGDASGTLGLMIFWKIKTL